MKGDEVAWAVATLVVTVLWVVAALAQGDPAPVDTTAVGAAAAAGTAAAVGAAWGFGAIRPLWLAGLTLVVLPVATASATGGSAPVLPMALLLLAGAIVVSSFVGSSSPAATAGSTAGTEESDRGMVWVEAVLVLLAAGLLLGAMASGKEGGDRWALVADGGTAATLGLVGAVALLVAAALGSSRVRAFAGPALLVGLVVAPGLSEVAVAAVGGVLAVLCAAVLSRRPGVALGFLGLGAAGTAAGLSAGRPAAALLAAGAVLALSYRGDHPAAGLLALPGAAALAVEAISAGGEAAPIVLVVAAAASAALLGLAAIGATSAIQVAPAGVLDESRLPWAAIPAAALGMWLVVAPGTWTWTGVSGLGPYDKGAAPAAAVGIAVVVLHAAVLLRDPPGGHGPESPTSAWSRAGTGR